MGRGRNIVRVMSVAAAMAAGGLSLLNSCTSTPAMVTEAPKVPGATFLGDRACAECHAEITQVFRSSAHARIHLESSQRRGQTGCESCHGPGSLHVATGGSRDRIVNPGANPAACYQCHTRTAAEFRLPQHHPVPEGKMNCVQCHDPHGMDVFKPAGGLILARWSESCAQCHFEQVRPVAFEHPAMREGCGTCHNPHGSINRKMLTQADLNLCLRCHAQVQGPAVARGGYYIGKTDHTSFIRMGACWSSGCHTAVHGSNVDPRLRY